jgi:hypothetical protein
LTIKNFVLSVPFGQKKPELGAFLAFFHVLGGICLKMRHSYFSQTGNLPKPKQYPAGTIGAIRGAKAELKACNQAR